MGQLQLSYLYGDASNYKLFGTKVFSNDTEVPLELIRIQIERKLIDGLYFVPEDWHIERLEFEGLGPEEDHACHEFESINSCDSIEKPSQDVADFLRSLGN